MPPSRTPTDRARDESLRLARVLAVVALAAAALGAVRIHAGPAPATALGLAAAGALLLAACRLAPAVVARAFVPLSHALERLGAALGTALLTLVYLAVVWPYARLLTAFGLLDAPAREPWPPPPGGRWHPVESADRAAHRGRAARPGARLARLAVALGDVVALVRWLSARPAWFLVPIVVLLSLLAFATLLGHATGLGPLVYTLF